MIKHQSRSKSTQGHTYAPPRILLASILDSITIAFDGNCCVYTYSSTIWSIIAAILS